MSVDPDPDSFCGSTNSGFRREPIWDTRYSRDSLSPASMASSSRAPDRAPSEHLFLNKLSADHSLNPAETFFRAAMHSQLQLVMFAAARASDNTFVINFPDIESAQNMYRVLLTTVVPKDTFRGASFDRGVADLLLEHVRTAKRIGSAPRNVPDRMDGARSVLVRCRIGAFGFEDVFTLDKCVACGKKQLEAEKMQLCSRCMGVKICSPQCMAAYWPDHKALCKYIREKFPQP